MRSPRIVAVFAAVVALMLLAPAAAARAKDTVHHGTNWSWTGPSGWTAAYGTYGITILGSKGATLDVGFSPTLCAAGATWNDSVRNYFAAQRTKLKNSGLVFDKVKAVTHPSGTGNNFRRQAITFHTKKGPKKKGTVTLEYDFTQNVDGTNYCYQLSVSRYSNKSSWSKMGPVLARVQKSLAYFGPGACESKEAC